jgi:hypothetical protein
VSAELLAQGLAVLGLAGTVETRGKLAVLALRDAKGWHAARDPQVRAAAVALAAEHGFTNLALALEDDCDGRAPLSRD